MGASDEVRLEVRHCGCACHPNRAHAVTCSLNRVGAYAGCECQGSYRPTAAMLNKAQDVAAENARLREELRLVDAARVQYRRERDEARQGLAVAEAARKGAEMASKSWMKTTLMAIDSAQANLAALNRARTVLDEQTRFLAGLDDLKWSSKDRIEKRAHVNRSSEILKPSGVRVDGKAMDTKVFEEHFGKPIVKASPQPGAPHRLEMSFPMKSLTIDDLRSHGIREAHLRAWASLLGIIEPKEKP